MHSAVDEVLRFHEFVEEWLSKSDENQAGWQRFEDVLTSGFEMVVPGGVRVGRAELIESFRQAQGARPGVTVEVREAQVIHGDENLEVVRYEEWQLHPDYANQRVSTAVLTRAEEAPLGWMWRSVHETWLPDPS
ncbi:MAG: DUF4440 domain-containing protein [Acidimicrobiales bacterium]